MAYLINLRGMRKKSVYAWLQFWGNITSFTFNISLYYHMHNYGTFRVHSGLLSLMNESPGRWLGDWLSRVPAEPHLHCCMCRRTESPEEQKPLIRTVDLSYTSVHYGLAMTCSIITHLNQLEKVGGRFFSEQRRYIKTSASQQGSRKQKVLSWPSQSESCVLLPCCTCNKTIQLSLSPSPLYTTLL